MSVYTCGQVNDISGEQRFVNADMPVIFLTQSAINGHGIYAVLDDTAKYHIYDDHIIVMNEGYSLYPEYMCPKNLLRHARRIVPSDIWNDNPNIKVVLQTKNIDIDDVQDLGYFYYRANNILFLYKHKKVALTKQEKAMVYLIKRIDSLEKR